MRGNNNNIRGPTSALTEFLKESGITATTIARRVRTRSGLGSAQTVAGASQSRENDHNENGESNENEAGDVDEEQTASPTRRTRASRAAEGYASDELDEPDEGPAPKKRRLTKAAQEKLKIKEKEKNKKAKGKRKKGDDEDYDDNEEDDDAYTALSKSMMANAATSSSKPPVGSFENCARCEKQFTVTRYTMAANPGPGFLCHQCAKASGADPFKKPAPSRKRKAPEEKRNIVKFEEKRLPSLVSLCIKIITLHIDDVEALGDIGAINMDKIAKAIAKNRSLTAENAPLFYDVTNTALTLYDVTSLTPQAFMTLASLNPNLTHLRLDFCGRLDNSVVTAWCTSLPSLKRVELLGPYLVRVPAWVSFFSAHPSLEGFLITQSPRFDLECMQALTKNCRGLRELRLKEVGKLDDSFVDVLANSDNNGKPLELHMIDLSDPTESCTEGACVRLLEALGTNLTHLNLSGHTLLGDEFLMNGIAAHAHKLTSLTLSNVPEMTDAGVADFFTAWTTSVEFDANPPLTELDLSRNSALSSLALSALLRHSGTALTRLSVNSFKEASASSLCEIYERCRYLRQLDVSWCREVDEFWVRDVMDRCKKIEEIKCWGCNKLTGVCPKKRNVRLYGLEMDTFA